MHPCHGHNSTSAQIARSLTLATLIAVPALVRAQGATPEAPSMMTAARPVAVVSVWDGATVLRPSDVVRIQVWRKPELSGEFTVGPDGALRHPVYHDAVVTDVPMHEVESRIRGVLLRFEAAPVFIVEPLLRVSVEGEVRQPGLYSMSAETTVGQAIALAGGTTSLSRTDRITVRRAHQVIRLHLNDDAATASTMRILSGDRILVPAQRHVFRDYIAPVASIAAAVGAAINIARR